jgi:predicted nuclease with TOPRIM domain
VKTQESKVGNIEKRLDRETNDLVEYVKWINSETVKLRDRVKKSEGIINDLKTSGEESVESLMETLYMMKIKQEELDQEA